MSLHKKQPGRFIYKLAAVIIAMCTVFISMPAVTAHAEEAVDPGICNEEEAPHEVADAGKSEEEEPSPGIEDAETQEDQDGEDEDVQTAVPETVSQDAETEFSEEEAADDAEDVNAADQKLMAGQNESGGDDPEPSNDNDIVQGEDSGESAAEDREETFVLKSVSLSDETAACDEGKAVCLKVTMVYTGDSWDDLNEINPERTRIQWTSSNPEVAKPATIAEVKTSSQKVTAEEDEADAVAPTQDIYETTVRQTITVKGLKEGKTVISVCIGGETRTCTVTVNPVPKALGKATGLRWDNTSTLYWGSVKNTNKYKLFVTVRTGLVKYSDYIIVSNRTSYDLESLIVSIIKAHKTKFNGAAFSVTAAVKPLTIDKERYKDGTAVKSPALRYLRTTYEEAVSRNGWYLRNGDWYYYIGGKMQTGWISFRGLRYYLGEDGKLKTDCWIGNRYVKSNGEMARDEWVDHYKYYVDKNGIKSSETKFSTKNWVQNKYGWRYKLPDGTYIKNKWKVINHRVYYFDKRGYVATGWLTLNGKRYHMNASGDIASGLGARETGWVKVGSSYYWCDNKGVLAKNQWVDRSQYYVGASGKRLSRLCYQYLRNVNTSNRLGYYVYNSATAPEQSIAGYNLAYKHGNRILVVDLRFTKDNVPVCFHDDLVGYARNKNGSVPGSKPSVSKLTLKQLNQYDYGIYKGNQYKGTGVLTLDEVAKWLRSHKDADIYIEVKTDKMSDRQIANTISILKKYKVVDRSSMTFDVVETADTRMQRVHKAAPTLRIGLMAAQVNSTVYAQAAKAKGVNNEVFLFCWGPTQSGWAKTKLTQATVDKLRAKDIQFECGTFGGTTTLDAVLKYYASAAPYAYNSGVETAGTVFKKELMAATCHEKGRWVTVGNGKKYLQVDQTYAANKWMSIGSKKYYFNKSGFMVTKWLSLNGSRYYLGTDGVMATGWHKISGHTFYFDENGVMLKGTQQIGSSVYQFNSSGYLVKKIS